MSLGVSTRPVLELAQDNTKTSLLGVWENIYKFGYEKMRKSKSSGLRNDSTVKEEKV